MDLDLTQEPLKLRINLTRDADFVRTITATTGTFPDGATVILDFGTVEWPATVTTSEATWNVDKAAVNALIDIRPTRCHLRYASGGLDLLWAAGRPTIDG